MTIWSLKFKHKKVLKYKHCFILDFKKKKSYLNMEKNCIIMAVDNSKVNDSDTTQEEIYIQKAVNAMVDRVSYMRGIKI